MSSFLRNYVLNLLNLLRGDRLLRPLAVSYYATTQCNLHCAYCEDFARRDEAAGPPLALADAQQVLARIRSGTDRLTLTGGEPLLYPDIVPLVAHARRQLGFRHISLQTNGLLLAEHEALLAHVDRLVVSLDSTDPQVSSALTRVPLEASRAILDNVRTYAARQREFAFRLVANCVLSPETLPGAGQLLDFAAEHGLLVSFSPQAVDNWPRYELLVSDGYRALLHELLSRKRRGAPLLGSRAYLRTLLHFQPFSCYPTLIPRVMPNGDLIYPCWPIERGGYAHGGQPCNLLEVDSWRAAMRIAARDYGPPPRVCTSCFQQCYAEPSLMQARPLSLLAELLGHQASRRGNLASYAPG